MPLEAISQAAFSRASDIVSFLSLKLELSFYLFLSTRCFTDLDKLTFVKLAHCAYVLGSSLILSIIPAPAAPKKIRAQNWSKVAEN